MDHRNRADMAQELIQGALAVLALALGGALAIIGQVQGKGSVTVPDWLSLLIGAIVAFYFGRSGTIQAVREVTNGPLHTIADLVGQRTVRRTDMGEPPPAGSRL